MNRFLSNSQIKMSITTAAKLYLFLTIICMFSLVGLNCSKKPDISGITPKIINKGQLIWRCDYEGQTWIEARAYIFKQHPELPEDFKESKQLLTEIINNAREKQYTAPTENLRKSYKEEVESYTQGDMRYLAEWPNWPIIMISPVFLEGAKPSKAIAACRYEIKSVDIIFTMYCPDEISLGNFLDLTKLLTMQLENLSDEEWESLPKEKEPIFDSDGEVTLKQILEFTKDAVFPKQH